MQWVKGYLVGVAAGSLTALETVFEIPTSGNYPYLIIAPSVDCKDVKSRSYLSASQPPIKKFWTSTQNSAKSLHSRSATSLPPYNAVGNVYAAKELTEGGGEDPVEEATEVTFDFTVAGFANGTAMTDSIQGRYHIASRCRRQQQCTEVLQYRYSNAFLPKQHLDGLHCKPKIQYS